MIMEIDESLCFPRLGRIIKISVCVNVYEIKKNKKNFVIPT